MVPVAWFKSFSTQHGVHLVNYGHIYGKIDNQAWYALGLGYLVVDKLLTWHVLWFSVRSSQDILHSSTLLSEYSHLWLQINNAKLEGEKKL